MFRPTISGGIRIRKSTHSWMATQFEIYRPFCKRIYRVDRVEDLPRIIERAFHLSMSGRPGPVLVDVPMDHFSSNLFVDAFSKVPPAVTNQRWIRRPRRRSWKHWHRPNVRSSMRAAA